MLVRGDVRIDLEELENFIAEKVKYNVRLTWVKGKKNYDNTQDFSRDMLQKEDTFVFELIPDIKR